MMHPDNCVELEDMSIIFPKVHIIPKPYTVTRDPSVYALCLSYQPLLTDLEGF